MLNIIQVIGSFERFLKCILKLMHSSLSKSIIIQISGFCSSGSLYIRPSFIYWANNLHFSSSKLIKLTKFHFVWLVFVSLLLDYSWCGLRKSYSTDSCLIRLLDSNKDNTTNGLFNGMIIIDLQKAFDTVDHNTLFGTLELIGVRSFSF